MALPRKLKHLNVFIDGDNWVGVAESYTPAKLTRKFEKYRGAGMPGAADIDMGLDDEALATSFVFGGYEAALLRKMSEEKVDGVMLRFAGSYQRDDTGEVIAVEIVQRGRFTERDAGEQKTAESTQVTMNMTNVYYKETVDGENLVEVDVVNMVEIVNGKDMMAAHRRAIGL
ncbi:phage major tail tube protein [Motilimonas sp. 1_MG-2023]|uniref:phage major tail tube protein n=1 Tax=Motilimonas sp. 1_MG-2023 TaxID=3062672 RepID=UPI0026E38644|nr:phage major tail tube protein [Motilimonas sp. 1_MG-2023]MDO6525431.1 phage major tail tube protein [Motilimonas sp. 1_MG-2023]